MLLPYHAIIFVIFSQVLLGLCLTFGFLPCSCLSVFGLIPGFDPHLPSTSHKPLFFVIYKIFLNWTCYALTVSYWVQNPCSYCAQTVKARRKLAMLWWFGIKNNYRSALTKKSNSVLFQTKKHKIYSLLRQKSKPGKQSEYRQIHSRRHQQEAHSPKESQCSQSLILENKTLEVSPGKKDWMKVHNVWRQTGKLWG